MKECVQCQDCRYWQKALTQTKNIGWGLCTSSEMGEAISIDDQTGAVFIIETRLDFGCTEGKIKIKGRPSKNGGKKG